MRLGEDGPIKRVFHHPVIFTRRWFMMKNVMTAEGERFSIASQMPRVKKRV